MIKFRCDMCGKEKETNLKEKGYGIPNPLSLGKLEEHSRLNIEGVVDVCGECQNQIERVYKEVSAKYTSRISKEVKARIMLELLKK